ncbi:MAG: hypothetical protein IPH07_20845 [Deltaproteobacteria bacterium]|nr:hypothetical protein [Deltaproteobacteria bacterium]MBK8716162.1 hypothetical protein [Deltaproteobacteria bacterium]MBP7292093.1 hypothetical protein [Nannocystaceae bacterium]
MIDATVRACAPETGSAESCAVPEFHRGLSEAAADPKNGKFIGFVPSTREVRCINGITRTHDVRERLLHEVAPWSYDGVEPAPTCYASCT